VVVKRGAAGATWFGAGGGGAVHVDAVPVDATDTTGAGDAFAAGFPPGRLAGRPAGGALSGGGAAGGPGGGRAGGRPPPLRGPRARRPPPPPPPDFTEHVVDIDVADEMQGSFLEYAYSVIYSRALPDARDGLKPVHRRILFQMADMGLRPDRGHVKSARVVGE